MGEIVAILALTAIIFYLGWDKHRDREFFFKTIGDMNNKLMSRSLGEYASNKSKIERLPDAPVSAEERVVETELRRESADTFLVD